MLGFLDPHEFAQHLGPRRLVACGQFLALAGPHGQQNIVAGDLFQRTGGGIGAFHARHFHDQARREQRLHELLDFRPPEETESTTIGGLVTEWMGHVPRVGETVERDGIRIEVLAGDDLKVEQVRVSKAEPQPHA